MYLIAALDSAELHDPYADTTAMKDFPFGLWRMTRLHTTLWKTAKTSPIHVLLKQCLCESDWQSKTLATTNIQVNMHCTSIRSKYTQHTKEEDAKWNPWQCKKQLIEESSLPTPTGDSAGEAKRLQVVKLQSENPEKLVTNALDNPKRHCIGFLEIRRVEAENIPRQRTRTNHGSRCQSSRSWRSQIVTFLWRARQAKMGTKESTSDLGSQVLQNSCKIDRCTGSHTFRVLPCLQKPRNPPHRKLKTRLLRPGHCLWSLCLPPPSSTCSCSCCWTHLSVSLKKTRRKPRRLSLTPQKTPSTLRKTYATQLQKSSETRKLDAISQVRAHWKRRKLYFNRLRFTEGTRRKRNQETTNPTKRKTKTNRIRLHHGRSSDRRSENRPHPPKKKGKKIPRKRMPRSKISRKASQRRLSIWSLRPPNPRLRVRFLLGYCHHVRIWLVLIWSEANLFLQRRREIWAPHFTAANLCCWWWRWWRSCSSRRRRRRRTWWWWWLWGFWIMVMDRWRREGVQLLE